MREKRRLNRSSNIYVRMMANRLNDMMKEKVSGKPYFVFVIYYEGALAFSMSVILLCYHYTASIMVIILSIFI